MKTLIKNGRVIAFEYGRHADIGNGVVVYENDRIIHVGHHYDGHCDTEIDARGKLVIPGFVNTHLHVTDTAFTRGLLEDVGVDRPNHWSLYKVLPAIRNAVGIDDELSAAACAFAELLLSGSTTVVELGFDFEMKEGGDIRTTERIADLAASTGIRSYIAPRYRSSYWTMGDGKPSYQDYPDKGWKRFEDCAAFCERYDGAHGGLVRTMLAPGQVDTCDPDLLRETRRAADSIKVPIQLHAGQSPAEYRSIQSRHGKSTIDYIRDSGLLGPDFIIGHGAFLAEDGRVQSLSEQELSVLADSGTTIAHLPSVQARQGRSMRSLGQYRKAGVRVALGTDTHPFDIVQEMRCAAQISRVNDGRPDSVSTHEVFHMATAAGADALGRPDLGRLSVGARADIVLVDITGPHATPMRDPFAFLVFSATGADIDTVIVDGKTVVHNRRVTTLDLERSLSRLRASAERVYASIDQLNL